MDEIRFGTTYQDVIIFPTLSWDLNGATAGAGSATPTGTWDAASTNWNPELDGTGTTGVWAGGYVARFAAGSDASGTYTVTVDGQQDIWGLCFDEGTVTLTPGTGGKLRLIKNNAEVDVASGLIATVATPITEDATPRGLAKKGAGTLILSSGANAYTGPTNVQAGILQLGAGDVLPDSSAVIVGGNVAGVTATLDLNGNSDTIGSLTLGGATTTSAAAVTTGAGTLTLGGNVAYNNANNPLGATIIGKLELGATRTFTVNNSTTAASDLTVSADISGTGFGLIKEGAGTLVLSGNNVAATGGTTVNAGAVQYESSAAINGTARDVTVNAGGAVVFGPSFETGTDIPTALLTRIVDTSAGAIAADNYAATNFDFNTPGLTAASLGAVGSVTYTGTLTPQGATYRLGGGGGTLTMSNTNAVTGTGNSLVVRGPGTVVLTAANDYDGTTTVSAGTLRIGAGGTTGSLSASSAISVDGALIFNRSDTITQGTDFGAASITGSGSLTKAGTGKLILNAANTYAGSTTLSAGTLRLTNTGAIGSSSSLSLATGTTLELRSDTTATFITPAMTSASAASVIINVDNNGSGSGNTLALSSGLNSQLTSSGTLTVNVTGGNTYALSIPTVNLGGGNSLTLNPTTANLSIGTLSATTNAPTANNITLTLGGTGIANSITTINETSNAGQQLIITKNTAATWTLGNVDTKQGNSHTVTNGNLILNGTFTFGISSATARTFTISGGTLHYNNIGAVQTKGTGAVLVMTTGSLDNTSGAAITTSTYNPNMQWGGNWTFIGSNGAASDLYLGTGPVAITGSTRQVTVQDAATTLTVGGIISGTSFGLTKAGAGTLKLTGASAYTGPTSITAGKLKIDTAGTINTTSSLTINGPTAEFMYNNSTTAFSKAITFTQGTLSGTGKIGVAVTVPVGGTLAPGASTGTLTVVGNTALNGTFLVDVDNLGGSDLLAVTGNLTLGGVLTIADLSKLVYPVYTIATYTGSLGGSSFASTNLGTTAYTVDTTSTPGSVLLVPEPATMALLALGGLGLLLSRKRK